MGCCHSKSNESSSCLPPPATLPSVNMSSSSVRPVDPVKSTIVDARKLEEGQKSERDPVQNQEEGVGKQKVEEEGPTLPKKEIFVIKHRKSHDRAKSYTDPTPDPSLTSEEKPANSDSNSKSNNNASSASAVRTSSCTKEEVDAILIQCGRLSRSNSFGMKASSSTRRYSGSKRSFDFDNNDAAQDSRTRSEEEEEGEARQRRDRRRDRASSSPRERRRRTPSREREEEYGKQQQRSKSKERTTSSGRPVSRSPGRRSETSNNGSGNSVNPANTKPGKMVSVPATVTSLVMDKSNNGPEVGTAGVKRISVKRNVGEGPRAAASPRSQSPARANNRSQSPARANNGKGSNNNNNSENHQPSLSRSSSRKAEHSPYRRNPLSEIDPNSLAYPQSNGGINKNRNKENEGPDVVKQSVNVILTQKSNPGTNNNKAIVQNAAGSRESRALGTNGSTEKQEVQEECNKSQLPESDGPRPQGLTRTRSARRSRDLDVNVESLLNPTNSYTALLLEDIQSFHQKNAQAPPSYPLPACVTKACSIVEAVADLNSGTGPLSDQFQKHNLSFGPSYFSKKPAEESARCPFMESGANAKDDLMEPSFEKYVTVQRGGSCLGGGHQGDMEEQQESSGSNSFAAGQWGISSSSWEPNSADSTDRWTSTSSSSKSNSYARDRDQRKVGRLNGASESGNKKGLSGKKRELVDHQRSGGGRVTAAGKGLQAANSHPVLASGASV